MTRPPYAALLGASLERTGDGAPVLAMPFAEDVLGRPGFVHGGAIAGLLELAAIVALEEALAGAAHADLVTITIDFMRGGRERTTRAAGRIVRLGNRMANVEATAWQDDSAAPIAAARLNFAVIRRPPG